MDKNKRYIKLSIGDYNCPLQFQETYIKEICEKENVKVVDWYRYEEKVPVFQVYLKGQLFC